MTSFKVTASPSQILALTNKAYLNPIDFNKLIKNKETNNKYIIINKIIILNVESNNKIELNYIGLNINHRKNVNLALNDNIIIDNKILDIKNTQYLSDITYEIDYRSTIRSNNNDVFDCNILSNIIKNQFDLQFMTINQRLTIEINGTQLLLIVKNINTVNINYFKHNKDKYIINDSLYGLLTNKTNINYIKANSSTLKLIGQNIEQNNQSLIVQNWKFENMGIGGLDKEFENIFRRAFASRIIPSTIIEKLGIQHIKGLLLYGPPGTGKTLIARQIGKMLNGKEPKIINGPEILNKFIGQSEENIRNIFRDAELEYLNRGNDSDLHVIIFDEIDSICKHRGSTNNNGVGDTVVNQLLSKIDGVNSLNNILIIGMTNRKDMIDEALLRPGRLEVHIEIGLPDEIGRLQILKIHTSKMNNNNLLADDVNLEELAELTKNYTGAEIEGLIKSASSFALNRLIDISDLTKKIDYQKIIITKNDFISAFNEIKLKYNSSINNISLKYIPYDIIIYNNSFQKIINNCSLLIDHIKNSEKTNLLSILFDGFNGVGKTALSCYLALNNNIPFIKIISSEELIGMTEFYKCNKIKEIFEDAYKSPLSIIILDDIERILEYVPIGMRFSNIILQLLLVLINKRPPIDKKLIILSTTSSKLILQDMGFKNLFTTNITIPSISNIDIKNILIKLNIFDDESIKLIVSSIIDPIPIKKLLMIAEMSKQGDQSKSIGERFIKCMDDFDI